MHPKLLFRTSTWSAAMLSIALAASAEAQVTRQDPTRAPLPGTVTDQPGVRLPAPVIEVPGANRDGGKPDMAPAILDDEFPLPIAATSKATPSGDVLLEPASGDPFFLGFAGGDYHPPATERIDPDLLAQVARLQEDGRWQSHTYAFVMLNKRITPARIAQMQELGVRILGFHPHYSLRVALPPAMVRELAALPDVRWVGVPKVWQKLDPRLLAAIGDLGAAGPAPVYINVHESDMSPAATSTHVGTMAISDLGEVKSAAPLSVDQVGRVWMSNGWQQQALAKLGVEIECYVDEIHAFKARATVPQLTGVLALDFVQFVEPDLPAVLHHDESTGMILADQVRAINNGGFNRVALAGQIDSGIRNAHTMLDHTFLVGWDFTGSAGGAFADVCRHGSHVAGTVLGEPPAALAGLRGVAPGLGWAANGRYRTAKFFNDACAGSGTAVASLFSTMRSPWSDGANISPKPHVINNSWGASGTGLVGSDANSRTLDGEVYTNDQVYVFSAGNDGSGASTLNTPGVAKNALTVGSVIDYRDAIGDPGTIWTGSSRGPAGGGRFKPNVVAPGRFITSADPVGTTDYRSLSGTSMAAPHVTGVVSLLMDNSNLGFLRYAPARVASVLMATATPKDDTALGTGVLGFDAHLNSYGAGRVNAYRAAFASSQFGWSNWATTQTSSGFSSGDFTINAGCTRLVAVMHYIEPASGAGASQALVNNFDLWLDQPPLTAGGNTGDWFSHQSTVDNTEIRILNNPIVGTWRWKVFPRSVSGTAKVSVTIATIYGSTTPDGTLSVSASNPYIQPNVTANITATATNPSYIASAVYLDSTVPGDTWLLGATTTLKDGAVTNLLTNQQAGFGVALGDILHGQNRSARWTASWASEGVKNWSVNARSDNWVDKTASVNITVDGTAPAMTATSINSGAVFTSSLDVNVAASATDALSGAVEMRYSSDNSTWSAWLPYQTTDRAYVLSANGGSTAEGPKTVWVQVRDRSGNISISRSDTINYVVGSFTSYGTACAGGNGADVQSASGLPRTGQVATYSLAGGRPNSAAFLVTGFSRTSWNGIPLPFAIPAAPGCSIYTSLVGLHNTATSATGTCSIGLPIPLDRNLIGGHFFSQYWCVDAGANSLGMTFSNGIDTRVSGNL